MLNVCVIVYLDDIPIYSDNIDIHKTHVREVLRRLRENASMPVLINVNNNNNNNNHLPGPPGGNCRSCSVPALFSPRHAVSHQAFRIYNIKPHQKVQHAALANRVVGANQLNSLPSHSHVRTHTHTFALTLTRSHSHSITFAFTNSIHSRTHNIHLHVHMCSAHICTFSCVQVFAYVNMARI